MIVEYYTTQRYENVIKSTPLSVSFNLCFSWFQSLFSRCHDCVRSKRNTNCMH